MSRHTTLLFDLDDTLLDTHRTHEQALGATVNHAASLHPTLNQQALRDNYLPCHALVESELEFGRRPFDSQQQFRARIWELVLERVGVAPEAAADLAATYMDARRKQYRLFSDVPECLPRLAAAFRLVLVTNGLSDLQREKIEATEIAGWFPHILVSGEVGSWKPDSGIFARALALADSTPDRTVMVGDSLARDVAGAQAVGIAGVWMRRLDQPHQPPHVLPNGVVNSLPDLERWLAETST